MKCRYIVEKLNELLKINGFMLHRNKKHLVYKDSRGRTFVTSKTASDWRAEQNNIKLLERMLGESIKYEEERKEMQRDTFNPPKMVIENASPQYKLWDEDAVLTAIKAKEGGKSYADIEQIIKAMGYRTKDGKPISASYISGRITQHAQKNGVTKRKTGNKLLQDITEVMTSNLSDEFKIRMIKQLVKG